MELHEFKKKGGEWLGAARTWIQWNCINGSHVTWNSDEALRTTHGPLNVKDVESIAAEAAHAAIKEIEEHHRIAFGIFCNDSVRAVFISDKGQFEGECEAKKVMEKLSKKDFEIWLPHACSEDKEKEYRAGHYWHLHHADIYESKS